jgi:hypothetical protein
MAKPLKDHYDRAYLSRLADELVKNISSFPKQKMTRFVFDQDWEQKELKQRMRQITLALHEYLPQKYEVSLQILKKVAPQFGGFEAMFFPDFV